MGKNRRNSPSSRATSKGQSLFHILWAETCALPRGCVWWNVASCPHSEKGKFVTEYNLNILSEILKTSYEILNLLCRKAN